MKFDVTIKDLNKQELRDLLRDLIDRIDENVPSVQQQPPSSSEQNPSVGGGGSAPLSPSSNGDLATPKQKVLMDKHKIKYDSSTTKSEASDRISSFFDSKKQQKKDEGLE